MGYSIGRWDGDTLVVESTGFTDRSWLDYDGHPHTEALKMVERYHRRDFGHPDLTVTFDDPCAYARPWIVNVPPDLFPDTELLEAVCRENEKDYSRMSGQPAGQQAAAIAVPRGVLAKYAGTYEIEDKGKARPAVISVSGDTLYLDLDQTGPQHTHFLMHAVEGEDRAVRKR